MEIDPRYLSVYCRVKRTLIDVSAGSLVTLAEADSSRVYILFAIGGSSTVNIQPNNDPVIGKGIVLDISFSHTYIAFDIRTSANLCQQQWRAIAAPGSGDVMVLEVLNDRLPSGVSSGLPQERPDPIDVNWENEECPI